MTWTTVPPDNNPIDRTPSATEAARKQRVGVCVHACMRGRGGTGNGREGAIHEAWLDLTAACELLIHLHLTYCPTATDLHTQWSWSKSDQLRHDCARYSHVGGPFTSDCDHLVRHCRSLLERHSGSIWGKTPTQGKTGRWPQCHEGMPQGVRQSVRHCRSPLVSLTDCQTLSNTVGQGLLAIQAVKEWDDGSGVTEVRL